MTDHKITCWRRRRPRLLRVDACLFWGLVSIQAALLWFAFGGGSPLN